MTTKAVMKSWNVTQWAKYVSEGLNNAAESIVQAGIRMYQFKTEAKCCKGGSEFGRLAQEKFGLSPSMSSRWVSIGINSSKLLANTKHLPNSLEAVYLVSTLSEDDIKYGVENSIINHEATQKEIKQLKKDLAPPQTRPSNPQDPPGPNGNEDEEWGKLVSLYGEELATAVWDEVINEEEAENINAGRIKNVKRMAKKLYGDKNDPNMLPSQVADILGLDTNETDTILGVQQQKKSFFFEVTPDVIALQTELENPSDLDAMRTEKARELYEHFKSIVEMWSEILEEK